MLHLTGLLIIPPNLLFLFRFNLTLFRIFTFHRFRHDSLDYEKIHLLKKLVHRLFIVGHIILTLSSISFPTDEALHLTNMLYNHGYFYSVERLEPVVRDDGELYRFQVTHESIIYSHVSLLYCLDTSSVAFSKL